MPPFDFDTDPHDPRGDAWEQENRDSGHNGGHAPKATEEPGWTTVLAWGIILAFAGTLLWGFVELILWITR